MPVSFKMQALDVLFYQAANLECKRLDPLSISQPPRLIHRLPTDEITRKFLQCSSGVSYTIATRT